MGYEIDFALDRHNNQYVPPNLNNTLKQKNQAPVVLYDPFAANPSHFLNN